MHSFKAFRTYPEANAFAKQQAKLFGQTTYVGSSDFGWIVKYLDFAVLEATLGNGPFRFLHDCLPA